MSHGPGRAPSSGTCFKELLLHSSGLNFLHMPSCRWGRHDRGNVVQWGEFRSTRAGWHRSSSGCRCISRWFWWPGCIFGRDLGDLREFFNGFSHSLDDIAPHTRGVLPLTVCRAHLSQLHLLEGLHWDRPSNPSLTAGSNPLCLTERPELGSGAASVPGPTLGSCVACGHFVLGNENKTFSKAAQPQISLHRHC